MTSTTTTSTALVKMLQSPAGAAAGKAMGELCVSGVIGAGCVTQKLITQEMVRALSRAIYTILLPCFIGTNILKTVSSQGGKLSRSSLCVPLVAVAQSALLFLLAKHILIPLFGLDPDSDEGKVLSVTCCFGNAGVLPFVFAESMFRDNASLLQRAYSQVSFFSVGWSPFFWSFVPKVLQISKKQDSNQNDNLLQRILQESKVFFPPPVMGVVVGLLLGLTPLSPLLLSLDAETKAPLAVVYNSFQNLGKAASPLAVLVLTCSLAFGAGKKLENGTTTSRAAFFQKWACVSVARFLVSPLVMLGILKALFAVHLIGSPQEEPMLWFVCLLQSIMPPAQNSVVLLQVAGKSEEASQMAKFLFSIYATSMIPIVGLVTASLDSLGIAP
ncbi:expressed unknown protein [Seminavis robusta]|uniref:Uncharacterized protein n=1 Tax=Seminavis robusta TaxID=568900 RepID=A0A9N8EWU7_9STRA|nr:expressed unknown protein [Seminavis robusta]|eukprot:Sro2299_g322450.1 n/a (386) ;mRNA; r:2806-3963